MVDDSQAQVWPVPPGPCPPFPPSVRTFGVIAISVDGHVGVVLRLLQLLLQEVEERQICRGRGEHVGFHALKGLESLHSLGKLLHLQEGDRLGDFKLARQVGKGRAFHILHAPVAAFCERALNDYRITRRHRMFAL